MRFLLLVGIVTILGPAFGAWQDDLSRVMHGGDHVLLVRHAYAPGTGDPAGFRPGNCATQRNLSDEGREQARAMGDWLRESGIGRARVYSSEWCRCVETAVLMDLGRVTPLAALNSFFQRPEEREPTVEALKDFLATQPAKAGPLVLVTHQVTITALTGEFMESGKGVLVRLDTNGVVTAVRPVDFGH